VLSDVAGIIDNKGGFRVVVTERHRFKHHVAKGERLYVVPGMKVQEPIPFENIHGIVTKVEEYVSSVTKPNNHCGGCQECCINPLIDDKKQFYKPAHTVCPNCTGKGCRVYFMRPEPCRGFKCLWLKSQKTNHPMGPELRPDRCGVYFVGDVLGEPGSMFEVHPRATDRDAVNRSPVRDFIEQEQAEGRRAYLVTHYEDMPA
jgi:hypothetical protein